MNLEENTLPASSTLPLPDAAMERKGVDTIEICYLTVIVFVGTILNLVVFFQLMRQSKTPTASTSFLTGPYYMSSFSLFKINLSITDFAILFLHTLGKVIWLITYEWKFGDYGCKIYQFLSAFTYYSNSNVVMAIGIDRLKVVYTSHIQGATSVRRVRLLLTCAWLLAAICALPQLFLWKNIEIAQGWQQCTTVWHIAEHYNTTTDTQHMLQFLYEMLHQSAVFWIPFVTLFVSYLLIVVKILRYSINSSVATAIDEISLAPKCHTKTRFNIRCYYHKRSSAYNESNFQQQYSISTALFDNNCPNTAKTSTTISNLEVAATFKQQELLNNSELSLPSVAAVATPSNKCSSASLRHCLIDNFVSREFNSNKKSLQAGLSLKPMRRKNTIRSFCKSITRYVYPPNSPSSLTKDDIKSINKQLLPLLHSRLSNNATGGFSVPIWRRQLRSKVFAISLAIVITHCALWLPYNLLNTLRFIDKRLYEKVAENGGLLLEDLIILNSFLNPLLYGYFD